MNKIRNERKRNNDINNKNNNISRYHNNKKYSKYSITFTENEQQYAS